MTLHHTMKPILLVFTGGTIGSQLSNGTIDTSASAGFKLIQLFRDDYPEQASINFKALQPVQILSENLQPAIWGQIIQAIEAENLNQFAGIIVTHGTDTLAFSAAMLGIYFNALKIPLLLVSSNLPLDNPKANGLKNFICAVEYIRQQQPAGVFVPYQNPDQPMHLHIGTRLSGCLPLSSDFISVQSRPYRRYENGHFSLQNPAIVSPKSLITLQARFARILIIKPYPGLNYDSFNLDHFDAVLHELYHSGTACAASTSGEQFSLIHFSQRCQQHALPLYLTPAIQSEEAYSSTRQLLAHGAQMIWNTSLEAAYAKLVLAYANFADPQDILDFLTSDIALETV